MNNSGSLDNYNALMHEFGKFYIKVYNLKNQSISMKNHTYCDDNIKHNKMQLVLILEKIKTRIRRLRASFHYSLRQQLKNPESFPVA